MRVRPGESTDTESLRVHAKLHLRKAAANADRSEKKEENRGGRSATDWGNSFKKGCLRGGQRCEGKENRGKNGCHQIHAAESRKGATRGQHSTEVGALGVRRYAANLRSHSGMGGKDAAFAYAGSSKQSAGVKKGTEGRLIFLSGRRGKGGA